MRNFPFVFLALFVSIQLYSQHIDKHWGGIKNPFFTFENCAIKDPHVIYCDDTQYFHLFFSCHYIENTQKKSFISCVTTKDFIHFSDTLFTLQDYSAPCIIQISESYILACNSISHNHSPSQLYYAESENLLDWTLPKPFANNLTNRIHAENPALVYDYGKFVLSWVEKNNLSERMRIAIGDSIGGNFKYIGMGRVKLTLETGQKSILKQHNGQFIKRFNKWFLLVEEYQPYNTFIYQMDEETESLLDWQTWTNGKILRLPVEPFNVEVNASTTFLLDLRRQDGYYYLILSGCSDNEAYEGTGNFTFGIARSKDLIYWSVP